MKLRVIKSGSSGNCYVLSDGDRYLLLDCGDNVRWQDVLAGCGFNISKVDGCLFTHWHKDHLGHLKHLHLSGVPTYSCSEVSEYAGDVCGERIHVLSEKRVHTVGEWKVVPWYVPHTGNAGEDVPCFAYMIESSGQRLVYMTDFLYSPLTFKSFGINTLLIACNHDDDVEEYPESDNFAHVVSGHSSLSVVKDIVRLNMTYSLRNVILCHLSNENASPSMMHKEIKDIVGEKVSVNIAKKGVVINL